ncbi:F-box protein [Camellia lanceoleosa]|uniref:F-box protein n=1 Tax=Camellia lanceoleosa TaxID=1840588 RepID=A0ACC0IRA9_9ERIC|nr:F-box protein [Camellia lanceoleosa]
MGLRRRKIKARKNNEDPKQKEDHQQHESSMEDLPHDLSLNILSRLPVSSLIPVKLVCKSWYNFATSLHHEPHNHNNNKNNPCLLVLSTPPHDQNHCIAEINVLYEIDNQDSYGVISKSIKQPINHNILNVNTTLSCNGLLCLICLKNNFSYRVCIFNPLTEEHKYLPDMPSVSQTVTRLRNCKYIDNEAYLYQRFGFGFNPSTNEFKVVRIAGIHNITHMVTLKKKKPFNWDFDPKNFRQKVDVFTLSRTGVWRSNIDMPFACPVESSGAVVNGAIHWLCSGRGQFKESCIVVSFDLSDEKFQVIPNPPDCEMGQGCELLVLGGCLAITDYYARQIDIWVMQEHGVKGSWTKEIVIIENLPRVSFTSPQWIHPLCLLSSGKIVISYKRGALYCFDPEEIEWLNIFTKRGLHPLDQFMAVSYTPSLVSPFLH